MTSCSISEISLRTVDLLCDGDSNVRDDQILGWIYPRKDIFQFGSVIKKNTETPVFSALEILVGLL